MLPEFSLQGKTAVVTGGARGLGLEMMEALAQAGAAVVAVDLLGDQAREAAEQTGNTYGVRAASWPLDVTDAEKVAATFAAIEREFGSIDILVAAAGITDQVSAEDVSVAAWRKVIDINLNGVFFCAQAAGRGMIARRSGSIILISSMSGLIVKMLLANPSPQVSGALNDLWSRVPPTCRRGPPEVRQQHLVNRPQRQASYNTAKGGVIMMAKSLAVEWAPHSVRVNALAPGYMRTALTDGVLEGQPGLRETWEGLTPMGRMGRPAELRGTVVYLASDASSFMTGHNLVVDGGYTAW